MRIRGTGKESLICKFCGKELVTYKCETRKYCSQLCAKTDRRGKFLGANSPNWNPNKVKVTDSPRYKIWYAANRERLIAAATARNSTPEGKEERNRRSRELYYPRHRPKKLAKLYGVDRQEMDQWLTISSCEICDSQYQLTIDHSHSTGKIRGRLCSKCNTGIGMFRDSPELLRKTIVYLEERARDDHSL